MLTLNDFFISGFVRDVLSSDEAPPGLLLDIGCGRRPYGTLCREHKWRSISVDIHSASAANIIADARQLPFGQGAFECILCLEVIEHIADYDKALSEMARLLKPGGVLAITWPFMYGMHDIPADYNRFSEFAMEKNLKRHGLAVVQLRRRGDTLGVLHTMLGQYGCGAIEVLTRIPWVGAILRPLHCVAQKLIQVTYWLHYALACRAHRLKPSVAGDGLRGIPGALALWTLGYCVVARKDGRGCQP